MELRKNRAIQPEMFLPEQVAKPSSSMETDEEQCENGASDAHVEVSSGNPNNATTSKQRRNSESRGKNGFHSSRGPPHAPPSRKKMDSERTITGSSYRTFFLFLEIKPVHLYIKRGKKIKRTQVLSCPLQ